MDLNAQHRCSQRSNSEQLEANAKMFSIIRKRNISIQEKVQMVLNILENNPQPDINAQDGNDNWNTALHLAVEGNELGVIRCLLSEGADTAIENGDEKTPLHLAKECNHTEIIDELKRCTSQEEWPPSGRERLASLTSQPVAANTNELSEFHSNSDTAVTDKQTASTVLPPFSGELIVDTELELSNDGFEQPIKQFYANKQLSAIDQLKATPPYPTPHVLAQFALLSYDDYQHGDPKPPDGWQLLTTASNFGIRNGYFGTAYWHPEYQQVVIAHRGTDITNVGAVVTDVKDVVFNNYVDQMSSASTFANKVVAVLQEIEQEKKAGFEVFFTGHSLGGWLAQITTFTTEYLEVKGGMYLMKMETGQVETLTKSSVLDSYDGVGWLVQITKITTKYIMGKAGSLLKKLKGEVPETLTSSTIKDSNDIRHSYHPHTVVFDSPGCKDMLSEMANKLGVSLKWHSIDLQHLDITSYLSAPNFANTCNSHLGTVYRIFTDLSDEGGKEKHTALYNLATHRMDKIVEAFDPKTGQLSKDEKGKLIIRHVVDWPVSAGLKSDGELEEFFKWAENLNIYHPDDVMKDSYNEVPKGYQPLHYQTKAYDECSHVLSVFTQDEREFLERYCLLRHVPEFFKPEDLFFLMNDDEAGKEAEQILQNFELDSETVRCPDASILLILIPYVKQLVRIFPHLKDKVKDQISLLQKRNSIYQYETQRYVTEIRNTAFDLSTGLVGLTEFLTSDQQIWQLQMIGGDAWTGITKVYRVLLNTLSMPTFFTKGHYTILKLKRLLMVYRMTNVNALLTSMQTPHLLMIACGTKQTVNDELRNMFKELFSILKQKKTMKIILTTQPEDDTSKCIQQIARETVGERLRTTDEQMAWSDLTGTKKREILEKIVIFQGRPVALDQLTSAEAMTDCFHADELLQEKNLRIGEDPVPSASSGYNEQYYVDRNFNHHIFIRQDILNDVREGNVADLLASTELEFKQLCEQNPTSNVHLLVEDESGELIWQQTKGTLKTLREYIDAQKSQSFASGEIDKLLQHTRNQKFVLIADKAGMGKSTVLTHLSKRIKQKYPSNWLVRIGLNDYTELFKAQNGANMDKGRILEFVSKEVLKLESHLEKTLFRKCFEGNEISKLVVMVDGFDKIIPKYKGIVLNMLHVLKQSPLEQLWVITRPHLREDLEDNLQQLSYTLQPLSEVEQVEFLKKFWTENLNLGDSHEPRLQSFAEALIRKFAESINDKDKEFTGIPFHTRMIAEAFEQDCLSDKSEPELDLLGLHKALVESKYNIYYQEQFKTAADTMAAEGIRERDLKYIKLEHQRLALEELFPEDQVTFVNINHRFTFSDEELSRIGIVYRNKEGKLQFIHRTFAEYFVAEFLINYMTKETKQNTKAKKTHGQKLTKPWTGSEETQHNQKEGKNNMFLYIAWNCAENTGRLEVLEALWHWATIVELNTHELLLAKNEFGDTALHIAAQTDHVETLNKLWMWAEETQDNQTKQNLFRAKNNAEYDAWHTAAYNGSLQVLDILWNWNKKLEINTDLLLAKTANEYTAFHLAAEYNHVEILNKIWTWAEEMKDDKKELKKTIFFAKDNVGHFAWHLAAKKDSLESSQLLRNWSMEVGMNRDKLLLEKTGKGRTAFHLAAQYNHVKTLKKLWAWAEEYNKNELKKNMFLAKDTLGFIAWNRAANEGNLEALEILWDWGKEVEVTTDELLLAKTVDEYTAFHLVAQENHVETLKKLWIWAEDSQLNQKELKKKAFLAKDKEGYFAWHWAADLGNLEILGTLWSWGKEVELSIDELLLHRTADKSTAFHLAAKNMQVETLKKLWIWADELPHDQKELKRNIFLAKDKHGCIAWHWAAYRGSLESLELLCVRAKELGLPTDEWLLAKNLNEETAFHLAAKDDHAETLKQLWVMAGEMQYNKRELKEKIFLAKNSSGYIALDIAEYKNNSDASEILRSFANELELNTDEMRRGKK